ncbi:MAG: hypothetical protein K8S54_13945 [Spirochaetia bacterium]|nr:hypothetical protein [Spirochaetia bacterium]
MNSLRKFSHSMWGENGIALLCEGQKITDYGYSFRRSTALHSSFFALRSNFLENAQFLAFVSLSKVMMRTKSISIFCLILSLATCGGSKDSSSGLLLALAGGGGNPAAVSPSDSTGTSVSQAVPTSEIQRLTEDLIGQQAMSINCEPAPFSTPPDFAACLSHINPDAKPDVSYWSYRSFSVDPVATFIQENCKNITRNHRGNGLVQDGDWSVIYPLPAELINELTTYCKPIQPTTPPVVLPPAPTPEDFTLTSLQIYPVDGKHLPESGVVDLLFNNDIVCPISQNKQTAVDNFANGNYSPNVTYFEPNSTYRVLVSSALKDQHGTPLGDSNTLGDISAAGAFLGVEFETAAGPCVPSYFESIGQGWGQGHYRFSLGSYPLNPQENTCMIPAGPALRSLDTIQGATVMRPGVVESLRPGNWKAYSTGAYSCAAPLVINDYNQHVSSYPPVALCIHRAGEPNEFVEAITYGTVDIATAKARCPRWIQLRSDPIDPDESYPTTSLNVSEGSENWKQNNNFRCEKEPSGHNPETCENSITLDTTQGRWYETPSTPVQVPGGKTIKQKGFHTFWDYEKLYLRVRGNCKPGWYSLKLTAMNYGGPLPEGYAAYYVSITNERDQKAYGLSVKASESAYNSGTVAVWIDKGDSDLSIRWTNDAYLEGKYDANLQIKAITLTQSKAIPPAPSTSLKSGKFCRMIGRYYGDTARIYANEPGGIVSFCFGDLESGKYEITVKATSKGALPEGYATFPIKVSGDGVESMANVPASTQAKSAKTTLDLRKGAGRLDLSWIDKGSASESASVQIESVSIKRIGDSQRSQLGAFLLNAGSSGFVIPAILLVIVSGAGILLLQRLRPSKR